MNTFLPLSLLTAFALVACGSQSNPMAEAPTDLDGLAARVSAITGNEASASPSGQVGQQAASGKPGEYRTYTIPYSPYGISIAEAEIPAHWKVTVKDGGWEATAKDVTVKVLPNKAFTHVTGQLAAFIPLNAQGMRAPVAPGQLVQEDLVPMMREQGFELIGQQDAPGVARVNQHFQDNLYSVAPTQKVARAHITDWKKGNTRVALVMNWSTLGAGDLTNWQYGLTRLEAPASRYEQEKAGLLHALTTTRYNPQFFAMYRQQEQMKEQQSWAAHNQRMQANQAAFDAQQAAHRDMVNSMNQSSMSSYRSRMESMDRQHEATIDMIRGEQNAVNPYTGQTGKVETGYENYWINQNGEYFGTDNTLYDPNVGNYDTDHWQRMGTE